MTKSVKSLERQIEKLEKALKGQNVKSVITATKEKPKSVLGSFVVIYEKATDKGFVPLRISYAPFKDGKSGMISIRQWNPRMKCHNYITFNVELTFGTLEKMFSIMEAVPHTTFVKSED